MPTPSGWSGRGGIATFALCPLATVADHVDQGMQRTWREAKIRRRGPAIGKLRVPHSNQVTRAVLDLADHVSFATMPLASHDPDASRPVPDVTAMDAV